MEDLADRIRAVVGEDPNSGEMRMFGGTCFTLNGNMLVVASRKGGLMARIGDASVKQVLGRPGAQRMVMRGREMKDYVTVSEDMLDDAALHEWIALATVYVGALPPKAEKNPAGGRKKAKT